MKKHPGLALSLFALFAVRSAPAVEPASASRPVPLEPRAAVPAPPRAAARLALDSIVTNDAFLPAVHINGASGVYRTDVWIFNPDPNLKAVVDLYYTEADRDGTSDTGLRITPDLEPRESVTVADIVGDPDYFNKALSYGLLEVRGTLNGQTEKTHDHD